MQEHFPCGPLEVSVEAGAAWLRAKLAGQLELFNVSWRGPLRCLALAVDECAEAGPACAGSYLVCARMLVDKSSNLLRATSPSGAWCEQLGDGWSWRLRVPRRSAEISEISEISEMWVRTDIESLLSLVLTTGWRAAGWVPLHAATIEKDGQCGLLCAESGGGKTSLTAAMIRRGFRTLGDDKLLLRVDGRGQPELRALVHTFNLHPRTRDWFPEVGDLERLPSYSEWTEKRKLHPESVWPGTTLERARPTHLLHLARRDGPGGIAVEPLAPAEVFSILLHQTVVPGDREAASQILAAVATTARTLRGFRVEIGDDAFRDREGLEPLDSLFE